MNADMNFYHSIPVQIRFNDVDPAQHVNNTVYQEYFDLGKVSYFREVTGNPLNFKGISLVVAGYKVDFLQPVFLDESVEVKTRINILGTKSLEMVQHLYGKGETSPRAVSTTTMVCFDYSTQLSEAIPANWKDKIRVFEHQECLDK
jgi:acyl-CoA thioester hydrolase